MRILATMATIAVLAGVLSAQCTTVMIPASQDNTLYENASGGVSNALGTGLFCAKTNSAGERRALLSFDVAAAVPPGSVIVSASLVVNIDMVSPDSTSFNIGVHRLLNDWGEGTSMAFGAGGLGGPASAGDATWLHTFSPGSFWGAPGGQSGVDYNAVASTTTPTGTTAGNLSLDGLAVDAQSMLDNPAINFGWILISDAPAASGRARRLQSREAAGSNPMLVVEYASPLPGTNEDLIMRSGVNGVFADTPIIKPSVGDILELEVTSPGNTFFFVPIVVGGQFYNPPTVIVPPAAAPEIQFDLTISPGPFAILDGSNTGGFLPLFIGNGYTLNFGPTPMGLTGLIVRMQVVLATPLAANGFYTTSNATDLIFP